MKTIKTLVLALILNLLIQQSVPGCTNSYDSTKTEGKSRRWYQPDFIPLQYAGNIGFLSTGAGITSRNQKYELALMYGYVPPSVARVTIHAITLKNVIPLDSYYLQNNQSLLPYLGLAVTLEVGGGNAFLKQPSHFAKSYYDFPKAIHATVFGGVKMRHLFESDFSHLRGLAFYAEAGTVDVYFWYKSISQEIKFRQIFSLALGVNLLLP